MRRFTTAAKVGVFAVVTVVAGFLIYRFVTKGGGSGKGYVVYTCLAWFRQLPEAVPGAYRLFANLVSLGK